MNSFCSRRHFLKANSFSLASLALAHLLRDERASSPLDQFTENGFQAVIDDATVPAADKIQRVLLCTGKVFYTLSAARDERKLSNVALVRVEQLYPFPKKEIETALARYSRAGEFFWVQEEPKNMGAWTFMEPRLSTLVPPGSRLEYRGRAEAASPAHGFYRIHHLEEHEFVKHALEILRPVERGAAGTNDARV